MRMVSLMLVLLLAFTFSCAAVYEGRKIDGLKVKQLNPGGTQVAKVEEFFGKPDKITKSPSGEDIYIYEYCAKNPRWWTISSLGAQKLEVTVKEGVVQTYKFTEEGKEAFLKD